MFKNKGFGSYLPKGTYGIAIMVMLVVMVIALLSPVMTFVSHNMEDKKEIFLPTSKVSKMEMGSYVAIPSAPIVGMISVKMDRNTASTLLGEGIIIENLANNIETASGAIANHGTVPQDIGILSLVYSQSGNTIAVGYIGDSSREHIKHVVLEPGEKMEFEIPLRWAPDIEPNLDTKPDSGIETTVSTNSILTRPKLPKL